LPEIQPFCNTDRPALLEIWRKCSLSQPEHYRPLSTTLLEQHILGSPIFDRYGLLLAHEENTPVGFAHAAFGPNEDHTGVDRSTGVICLVMVDPDRPGKEEIAAALLRAAENYLISKGATQIYGGASRPLAPFYMGLYGGSEPIGVFQSDRLITWLYQSAGYQTIQQTVLYRLSLENYRVPINAKTVSWRRTLSLTFDDSPKPSHWWEACMMCHFEWLEMTGTLSGSEIPVAGVVVRTMVSAEEQLQNYYSELGGLLNIQVDAEYRRKGLATYILGAMIRYLQRRNVRTLEVQAPADNDSLIALLRFMKWSEIEQGAVFLKKI